MSRARSEGGFSMIEVTLAMGVMMVVLISGMRAATSAVNVETQAVSKGQASTQAVIALTELRQEIVSANVIYDPAGEIYHSGSKSGQNYAGKNTDGTKIPAGWSLRIYTELNGIDECVQWRLLDATSGGLLQTRTWDPSWSLDGNGGIRPWSTLATNVDNASSVVPFALNYSANYGGTNSRLVNVVLYGSANDKYVTPITIETSIAARDAEYFPASTNDCYPVPTP